VSMLAASPHGQTARATRPVLASVARKDGGARGCEAGKPASVDEWL
jgi:hypothetical protein